MRSIVTVISIVLSCSFAVDATAQFGKKNKEEEVFIQAPTFRKDPANGEVIYKGTIKATGTTAELYDKFYTWFKSYYTNPTRLIKVNSPETGTLMVKPTIRLVGSDPKTGAETYDGQVIYSYEMIASDGEVSYAITRIHHKKQSYYGIENWITENEKAYHAVYSGYLVAVDENIQKAINGMKASLKN